MDKVEHPYPVLIERLKSIERSIYILNLVNNDLREILHKKKPLPQFVQDSFKRSALNRSKTTPTLALPAAPPTPIETEEMRLAASVIDKAKRTIENIGEKKSKSVTSLTTSTNQSVKSETNRSRPPSASSRPSPAVVVVAAQTESSAPQPTGPVRRFVPAHMKAPFLTQPEKKRRPTSSVRSNPKANSSTQKGNVTVPSARRSLSQQRRQLSASIIPSIDDLPLPTADVPTASISNVEVEINSPVVPSEFNSNDEPIEIENSLVPQPIILNRALIKPLRRLWKQNETLRLSLERDLSQKSSSLSSPPFINRLNDQIYSSINVERVVVPNVDVSLVLATKLRAIILHVLENSSFDDLENAMKRLNTLKQLVSRFEKIFSRRTNFVVCSTQFVESSTPFEIENFVSKKTKNRIVRYTDDGQLIAFTEVRFQQFENESRWIELNWHEELIRKYKQTINSSEQNPLELYRELMSLVTGLQTSTPIAVENRL